MKYLLAFVLLIASARAAVISSSTMPSSGWQGVVGISGGIPTSYTQYCNVKTGAGITTPAAWFSGFSYDPTRISDAQSYVLDPNDANWYKCSASGTGTTAPSSDLAHWTLIPKFAVGNGTTDDQPIIQYALLSCPDSKYVYLPTSSYRINATIQRKGANLSDNVQRPYSVEIRGDGPALTKILNYSGSQAIGFYCANFQARTMSITSGNARGSTSLVLVAFDQWMTTGIRSITVRRTMTDVQTSDVVPWEASYMTDTASQVVKVSTLNAGTKTVTFTPALNDAYASDYISINISEPYKCGLTGLYIENSTDTDTHTINMEGAQECWVQNCEIAKVSRHAIRIVSSFGCEFTLNTIHDTYDAQGDHGYGICFYQFSCNNLAYNNIGYKLRHFMPIEYGGQGNVYAYNYSFNPINGSGTSTDYLMGDALNHGGAMHYNLYEGNVMATIRFDSVLGSSRWTTVFRNQVQRNAAWAALKANAGSASYGSDIQKWNYNANLQANVYEAPPAAFTAGLRRWGTTQDNNDAGTITAATNASPIVVTLNTDFGTPAVFQTGDRMVVSGALGNTAANGTWIVTRIDGFNFGLQGTTGNGTYTANSGTASPGIDPKSQSTTYLDGEFDITTGVTTWFSGDHTLPNSYYLTAKPAWWDAGVWPSIGPDLANKFGTNPAERRFNVLSGSPLYRPGSRTLLLSF